MKLLLLFVSLAFAGPADDAAIEADRVNQAACLDVAEQRAVNKAGVAMAEVSVVWVRVDEVYTAAPAPKPKHLLYWRGVLGQCLDRDELARADLVRDAKRRITRLERGDDPGWDNATLPRVVLSFGGGLQRQEAPDVAWGWSFGEASFDGSVRLAGPLNLQGFLRFGVSEEHTDREDNPLGDGENGRIYSLQPLFGVGPILRFAGPPYGFIGLLAQFAPTEFSHLGSEFLVGAALTGGVEIPFGTSPVGAKLWGEVGFLNASVTLRGLGGIFVRIGQDG